MKLFYKKLITFLTAGILGIGLISFSFQPDSTDTHGVSSEADVASTAATVAPTPISTMTNTPIPTALPTPTKSELPSPTNTPSPSPTPIPNTLVLCTDAEINALINHYYDARISCQLADFEGLLIPDATEAYVLDVIKKMAYIVGYQNISCYQKNGLTEDELVIYTSMNIMLNTIDTPAPSSDVLYIRYVDGKAKIVSSPSAEIRAYVETLANDEDLVAFRAEIERQFDAACQRDEMLMEFYRKLLELTNTQ